MLLAAAPTSADSRGDRHRVGRRQTFQLVGDDDRHRRLDVGTRPVSQLTPVLHNPSGVESVSRRGDPHHRRSGGAGDRDRDVLGRGRALRIRHGHHVGQREDFAFGNEVAEPDRQFGEAPADRSMAGAGAVGRKTGEGPYGGGQRLIEDRQRGRRQREGGRDARRRVGQRAGRRRDRNRVGVGEIGIVEQDRARRRHMSRSDRRPAHWCRRGTRWSAAPRS